MLLLEPTVEFEPLDWAGEPVHKIIPTERWVEYWADYLNGLGIQPSYPGSWYISVSILQEPQLLRRLMLLVLSGSGVVGFPNSDDEEVDDDAECFMPLNGGYILRKAENVLFTPHCCCDLGDINDWQEIAEWQGTEWHCLSMGHAMMEVRRQGVQVILRENSEYRNCDPIIEILKVSELKAAIDSARETLVSFKERLVPVLFDLLRDQERSTNLAKLFTGLA